jgi:hypothetical protein
MSARSDRKDGTLLVCGLFMSAAVLLGWMGYMCAWVLADAFQRVL